MSIYSNQLQPALQNLLQTCCSVLPPEIVMHDAIIGRRFRQRKSLVKPVTRQNISSCSVLSPEIVMHYTFSVSLWTSADICVVVHDDLGWKNQTTRYKCWFSAASMDLQVIFVHRKRPPIYVSCMTISGGRTEHDVVMAFGELAAVD